MSIESFFAQLSQRNYQRDLSYNEEKVHAWEKIENLFKSGFCFPLFHIFGDTYHFVFEDDIKVRFMEHFFSKDDYDELRIALRKKLETVSEITRITKQTSYEDLECFVDNKIPTIEMVKNWMIEKFPEYLELNEDAKKEKLFYHLNTLFENLFLNPIREVFSAYYIAVFKEEIQLKFMEQYFSTEDCELRVLMRKKLETVSEITRLKHSEDFITLMQWAYEYV